MRAEATGNLFGLAGFAPISPEVRDPGVPPFGVSAGSLVLSICSLILFLPWRVGVTSSTKFGSAWRKFPTFRNLRLHLARHLGSPRAGRAVAVSPRSAAPPGVAWEEFLGGAFPPGSPQRFAASLPACPSPLSVGSSLVCGGPSAACPRCGAKPRRSVPGLGALLGRVWRRLSCVRSRWNPRNPAIPAVAAGGLRGAPHRCDDGWRSPRKSSGRRRNFVRARNRALLGRDRSVDERPARRVAPAPRGRGARSGGSCQSGPKNSAGFVALEGLIRSAWRCRVRAGKDGEIVIILVVCRWA